MLNWVDVSDVINKARLPNFHFSLWPCDCSTWRLNMASFVSIQVSSANATLVLWSVVSLDPSQRFLDLFSSIQAGKFSIIRTSSELSATVLKSVCIRRIGQVQLVTGGERPERR